MSILLTHSGRIIETNNITENDICLKDIIFALSNMPRFTGHVSNHWSVLHHSLLVGEICKAIADDVQFDDTVISLTMKTLRSDLYIPYTQPKTNLIKMGLLHDATEAYLADIPSPMKEQLPSYTVLEQKLNSIIMDKFSVTPNKLDSIICKLADRVALRMEGTYFFDKWIEAVPHLEFKFDIDSRRLFMDILATPKGRAMELFKSIEDTNTYNIQI